MTASAYRHDITHCFGIPNGPDESVYETKLAELSPFVASLKSTPCRLTSALLALPGERDDLGMLRDLAASLRERFSHIIVAGSGGSGLSGRMLAHMAPPAASGGVHFLENIDPELMEGLLAQVDIAKTCFIIISKSGGTVETLSQFYALVHLVEKTAGKPHVGSHFVVITMPGRSPLRQSAESYGMTLLDHPEAIGGRFSMLTAVGLLPAALCGLDIEALRQGAAQVAAQTLEANGGTDLPPAQGAAMQYAAMSGGRNITVMLPYSDRLCGLSAWYRQSWAESLGKDGKGTTPIRAVGSTDQHSQLQLYLSGPKDKLFTFITCNRAGTGLPIHAPESLGYLKGKTLGDVMEAEQQATMATLIRNGCPLRLITLNTLGEYEMGALLMHFTLEILFMARLLSVNPFDQPAVEEGKQLAREYLLGAPA